MFTDTVLTPSWYLKGGYAIELRIETARTTKDIDLSIAAREAITPDSLHRMVDDAASLDLPDGFVFQIGESILDLDAVPQGGSRFPVQARMAGRPFVGFHLDIGIGDELIEPTDRIEGEGWFDFAGLPRPAFRMISREQQFAEKLHAYTRPRLDRDNSRVKDLVDLLLMQTEMERPVFFCYPRFKTPAFSPVLWSRREQPLAGTRYPLSRNPCGRRYWQAAAGMS